MPTSPVLRPGPAAQPFRDLLSRALARRQPLLTQNTTQAFRVFSGPSEGLDGVFVDVYHTGVTLILYEGKAPRSFDPAPRANDVLEILHPLGVRAVYLKPFAKDRSRLGGELPEESTNPTPIAGEAQPESLLVREHDWSLEIRLYDGLSTGLFLDQRENRRWVARWCADRLRAAGRPPLVLNTFAYTCAFSVAAGTAGALTTSVDVSPRYLDWGKRNFAHNDIAITPPPTDPAAVPHRFVKMDTFEHFAYARRKGLRYDLIILDPPSFASGNKRKGIRPWSSVEDYARLVKEAAALLNPKGAVFASTNTQELCRPGRLEGEITKGIGRRPRWLDLPPIGLDFQSERDRFAARAFTL